MIEQLIREILTDDAKDLVGTGVDLKPRIRSRLEALPSRRGWRDRQGDSLRFVAIAAGLLIVVFTLLLGTPAGRAWAGQLVRFFSRAESDIRSLPPNFTIMPTVAMPTLQPTRILGLKAAFGPSTEAALASTPTSTVEARPTPTSLDRIKVGSFAEAEILAGFEVVEPAWLPKGYALTDIVYIPQKQEVVQWYAFQVDNKGYFFQIGQSLVPQNSLIGPETEVETLQIGDVTVEFVQGSWEYAAGSSEEVWISETGVYHMRWQRDGFTFTLFFLMNGDFHPGWMDKSEMVALAEGLLGSNPPVSKALDPSFLTSLEEAEQVAGFDLLEPAVIPEEFVFKYAQYDPDTRLVRIVYGLEDRSGTSDLVIFEQPASDGQHYPPEEGAEIIEVNGVAGQYIAEQLDKVHQHLAWTANGLKIDIYFGSSVLYNGRLGKEEMIEIAESMK